MENELGRLNSVCGTSGLREIVLTHGTVNLLSDALRGIASTSLREKPAKIFTILIEATAREGGPKDPFIFLRVSICGAQAIRIP